MSGSLLQVRIDGKQRQEAAEILGNLGLDMSSAVRLFLNRVVIEQGLPFSMTLEDKSKKFDPAEYLDSFGDEK